MNKDNLEIPASNTGITETTKKVYTPPTIVELGNINDLVKAGFNRKFDKFGNPLSNDDVSFS